MLSLKLKEKTKTNHQLLEVKLLAQIKAIRNTQDYAEILALFYSFFGGLEALMAQQDSAAFLPDNSQRRKAALLADDLLALGAKLPSLATGNALPSMTNTLQTAGVLYVMEGSTLGGIHIAKMIRTKLDLAMRPALSFFNGYSGQTERMWKVFKECIDKLPLSVWEEEIVIKAANDTFISFSNWFNVQSIKDVLK